jgi:DNA-binding HxlR family transcriptional regulator
MNTVMTSSELTPQIGRIILGQLETPKRESELEIPGYKSWDAWSRQTLSRHLETLAESGYVAREPTPDKVRTPGPWRVTEKGREAMTRGDFLAE